MTLRLGLLSTARINRAILTGASATDSVVVAAVASRDPATAAAYARDNGIDRSHGSYAALLADPEVDAVYISLPNGMHHEWTLRALEAGKHVLCEKPYSRHPEEVAAAFDRAETAGLVLMEAFMYRHHPQITKLVELVSNGAVGELRLVRASFSFMLTDLGNVRARPELDGGALMDVGCYCVSGARLLAGMPEAVHGEQVVGSTGVDMTFTGTLRCPGDVLAQIDASFALPERQRLEGLGADGAVILEAPWRADLGGRLLLRRGGTEEVVAVPDADSYRLQLDNLAAAVAGSAAPLLGRSDALAQARVIEALYRSAETGSRVSL